MLRKVRREVQDSRRHRRQHARPLAGRGGAEPAAAARAAIATCSSRSSEHPLFIRDGQNLIVRMPIGYAQAALGCTLEVPTLDGREELNDSGRHPVGRSVQAARPGHAASARPAVGDLLVQVQDRRAQETDRRGKRNCCANWPSWSTST